MPDAADLSYERLTAARVAACQLLDSGVLYIHEREHLTEVIARIGQAVRLKRERGQHQAERRTRRPSQDASAAPVGSRD